MGEGGEGGRGQPQLALAIGGYLPSIQTDTMHQATNWEVK